MLFKDVIFDEKIVGKQACAMLASKVRNNDGEYYAEYGCHDENFDIDAIFFDGYKDTKVFAYIGIPKGAEKDSVPGVVLVHGGLGKAEIGWVKKWNKEGFAAIAVDLYGDGPEDDDTNPYGTGKKKTPYAGKSPWDFNFDYKNAGMYYNIVSVIGASELLRRDERVDKERIGVVGISWGGITTLISSGVDDRFAFAASVYGCGFLNECRTYFHSAYDGEGDVAWDPANFAALAKMPILMLNGDSDKHFSVNSTSKTFGVVKNGHLGICHGLVHSQEVGDSLRQVYSFAKSVVMGGKPFVKITETKLGGGLLKLKLSDKNIKSAALYYLTEAEIGYGGEENVVWRRSEKYELSDSDIVFEIPDDATYFYATIEDGDENITSTRLLKA